VYFENALFLFGHGTNSPPRMDKTKNTTMKGGEKGVTQVYMPEKKSCMPDKKIFLARAGARYSFLVKERDFMERATDCS